MLRAIEAQASLDARVAAQSEFFTRRLEPVERRRLLDEYASRPPIPAAGHRPMAQCAPGKRAMRTQTRYRDGRIASTKGERFLVQPKEAPDFVRDTSVSIRIYAGGRTH